MTSTPLMTIAELADHLGFSTRTIYNWRSARMGPPSFDLYGSPRYRVEEVDAWLEDQRG